MTERRRAVRVPITPPGPVSVVGARLVDVSPSGMRIESPVAIPVDAVLAFRIVVEGRASNVRCRVAACRADPGGQPHYGIGLEFLDFAPDAREHLREVLQRHAT